MSLQKASGRKRSRTLSTSISPLGEGEREVWNFSNHSLAILTGSMFFGGEMPRLLKVGRVGTAAEAIVLRAGEHRQEL